MPDYAKVLNNAQYQAATSDARATLVVAGAGSGKTRVIVHRLAWLVEQGVPPESILLLTFTRKAAQEMMHRAGELLPAGLSGVTGGTFHSFAFGALRRFKPAWLEGRNFSVMDSGDITDAIRHYREAALGGKKDPSFPKSQTIASLLSKARNKEMSITETLRRDSFHLLPHAEIIEEIGAAYQAFKREKALLDYDDLLLELEELLKANGYAADELRRRYRHILVDEYQDTNLAQARIVRLMAGPLPVPGMAPLLVSNVMAVGDEAQSIYAFRGANVRNILDFPNLFPDAKIIRLEENYRSTQPILDVANNILQHASESYRKHLFTRKTGGELPRLVVPLSDSSEARLVARRIEDLLAEYRPSDIAVLFRSGFHSFPLETILRQSQIPFRKYGGVRFVEAAHIKDALSFARIALNPLDYQAFARIASMHSGIGPKTSQKLYDATRRNDVDARKKAFKRFGDFAADLEFASSLRAENPEPETFFGKLLEYFRPRLEMRYADDWPSRARELESLVNLASAYTDLELFVADLSLDTPDDERASSEDQITLSTIHSAKGLEWKVVILLDLVEDRFPSRHAQAHAEEYEEERRLFYVACTRARERLELYAPATVYNRSVQGHEPVAQSPFAREIEPRLLQKSYENYGGELFRAAAGSSPAKDCAMAFDEGQEAAPEVANEPSPPLKMGSLRYGDTGWCWHKIFGKGKILEWPAPDKARVKFTGYGEKIIIADYLFPEE